MKNFKIHKSTKKELEAAIKDLPKIPYMIPDPVTGEPVVKIIKKNIKVTGKEILKVDPDAKDGKGNPINPDHVYLQPTETPMFQDHWAAITKAYKQYGPEAISEYCKQVWEFHHAIQSLPPEPPKIITEETPEISTESPDIILE